MFASAVRAPCVGRAERRLRSRENRKTPGWQPPQPPTASSVLCWWLQLQTPSGLPQVQGEEEGLRFPRRLYKTRRLRGSLHWPACMAGLDPQGSCTRPRAWLGLTPTPTFSTDEAVKSVSKFRGPPDLSEPGALAMYAGGSQPVSLCQSTTCLRSPPRLSPLWSWTRCTQRSG